MATKQRMTNVVKLLLDHGADMSSKDQVRYFINVLKLNSHELNAKGQMCWH